MQLLFSCFGPLPNYLSWEFEPSAFTPPFISCQRLSRETLGPLLGVQVKEASRCCLWMSLTTNFEDSVYIVTQTTHTHIYIYIYYIYILFFSKCIPVLVFCSSCVGTVTLELFSFSSQAAFGPSFQHQTSIVQQWVVELRCR